MRGETKEAANKAGAGGGAAPTFFLRMPPPFSAIDLMAGLGAVLEGRLAARSCIAWIAGEGGLGLEMAAQLSDGKTIPQSWNGMEGGRRVSE